jgi:DNA-binding SARP family transcriptional activator
VPPARPVLESRAAGVHVRRLAVARAVAAAREGGPLDRRDVDVLSAELVTTCVPLPWALTLAARLHEDGHAAGREIALWSIERYGQPARDALRDASAGGPVTTGAKALLAAVAIASHTIDVGVLGPVALRVDGVLPDGLDWQRERVRALLLYFVVHGAARREDVAEALWPGLAPDAADRNLRVTLAYLQKVLEPDRRKGEPPFFLRQEGALLSLAGRPHVTVDALEFTAEVAQASHADRRGLPSVALELLEQATARWRGRCLEDVAFAEWAQPTSHELTADFVAASVRAGELHLAAGRTVDARRHARRALGADQWCEPAHRVIVAAALADGDRGGAARALTACDAMLADLGVTADPDTDLLRRQVHARAAAAAA